MNIQRPRTSKKDKRHAIGRQSEFHFPGFTSSSSDDDEPPVSVKKRKRTKKRIKPTSSNKKKKPTSTKNLNVKKTNRSCKQQDSIQKKLVYGHPQHCSNASPIWKPTKTSAPAPEKPKYDAAKETMLASVELIQDPPMMRRITNPQVISGVPYPQDPPERFLPYVVAPQGLESPSYDNDYQPVPSRKWSKLRSVFHTKYILILLFAYAVPYFHNDMDWTTKPAVVYKPQGVKNQSWRLALPEEHNVFFPETIASKEENCSKSSFSSFFSFY